MFSWIGYAISWLPLLSAATLASLIYLRGWIPAVAESSRLDEASLDVTARQDALQATRDEFAIDEARVADPFWRARLEKTLGRTGEPLRLDSLVRTDAARTE